MPTEDTFNYLKSEIRKGLNLSTRITSIGANEKTLNHIISNVEGRQVKAYLLTQEQQKQHGITQILHGIPILIEDLPDGVVETHFTVQGDVYGKPFTPTQSHMLTFIGME